MSLGEVLGVLLESQIDQVGDHVKRLLGVLASGQAASAGDLMIPLGLAQPPSFRANYLRPLLAAGRVVMPQLDSTRSTTQRYRRA